MLNLKNIVPFIALIATISAQFSPQQNLFDPILRQENHIGPDGRYKYGFQSNVAARDEIRGDDGVTRGYYAYIDDRGEMQYVFYTAGNDGFKVQAISNMKPMPQTAPSSPPSNLRFEQIGETELQQRDPTRFHPQQSQHRLASTTNLFGPIYNQPQANFANFETVINSNPKFGAQQEQKVEAVPRLATPVPVKVASQVMYPLDIGINLFTGQKLTNDHFLANYYHGNQRRAQSAFV